METFEIHITGSQNIVTWLADLDLKHLTIHALKPDGNVVATEYMSSIVEHFPSIDVAVKYTEALATILECKGVTIFRKKIECPYMSHYINRALYLETHFEIKNLISLPMSGIERQNKPFGVKLMATDRTYFQDNYGSFLVRYRDESKEMCLYDTNIGHDKEWFDHYIGSLYDSTR